MPGMLTLERGCRVFKREWTNGFLIIESIYHEGLTPYYVLRTPEGRTIFQRTPASDLSHVGADHRNCEGEH